MAEAEAADEKPEPAAEAAGTDVPAAEPAAPADAQPTEVITALGRPPGQLCKHHTAGKWLQAHSVPQ